MHFPRFAKGGSTSTLIRVLTVCLVTFDLLIIAFAASSLLKSRRQQVERAEMATHNLAQVLEQSLLATARQIDLVLLTVKDEVERKGLPEGRKQVADHIQEQFARVRILDALRTVNAEGLIEQGTALPDGQPITIGDRDYFQYLKSHPEAGLYISGPLMGRINGRWLVVFARRLNRPDGGFGGAVYGQITLEELSRNLSQVDVGEHGSISLRGGDLSLLARYPAVGGLNGLMGDRTATGEYLKAVQSQRTVTHFTAVSTLDGTIRTYTLRRMTDPDFFILVGFSQRDYLATWRREAYLAGITVVGLLALSVLMVWMARMAWRRQLLDQAQLAHQEEKYRMLAENALDVIWTADAEGRLTFVSPSLHPRALLPPEISGIGSGHHPVLGRVHDQLWARLSGVKALLPGSQPFEGEVLELAVPTPEGRLLQAEVRVRVLWGPSNALLGFQGVTRDITEKKAAEQALLESEKRFRSLFYDAPVGHALNRLEDGWFLAVNDAFAAITGYTLDELNALTSWDLTPSTFAEQEAQKLASLRAVGRYGPYEKEYLHKDGRRIPVVLNGSLVHDPDGTELILSVVADITERKRGEAEREQLIRDLQQALDEVRTLGGMLPICSHCKKIRDDQGYWKQIEAYITAHSEATFTHGICPDCAGAFFPKGEKGVSEG